VFHFKQYANGYNAEFFFENAGPDAGSGVDVFIGTQSGATGNTTIWMNTNAVAWAMQIDNADSDTFKIGTFPIGTNPWFAIDTSGNLKLKASNAANGTVATVLGSLGPAGSHTTVQEWFKVQINGVDRYIPCF
jgi:hypothetical protein